MICHLTGLPPILPPFLALILPPFLTPILPPLLPPFLPPILPRSPLPSSPLSSLPSSLSFSPSRLPLLVCVCLTEPNLVFLSMIGMSSTAGSPKASAGMNADIEALGNSQALADISAIVRRIGVNVPLSGVKQDILDENLRHEAARQKETVEKHRALQVGCQEECTATWEL